MRKLTFLLIIVLVLLPSTTVPAKGLTSADYLKYCTETVKLYNRISADKFEAGVCLGFVDGAVSKHYADIVTDRTNLFCMPEAGISTVDIITLWIKYLEKKPEMHEMKPIVTFSSAMTEAFPCDEASNKKK